MRKLVYDCYYRGIKTETVADYKTAKAWADAHRCNSYKERFEDMRKEETEEERNKRLERIAKRNAKRVVV